MLNSNILFYHGNKVIIKMLFLIKLWWWWLKWLAGCLILYFFKLWFRYYPCFTRDAWKYRRENNADILLQWCPHMQHLSIQNPGTCMLRLLFQDKDIADWKFYLNGSFYQRPTIRIHTDAFLFKIKIVKKPRADGKTRFRNLYVTPFAIVVSQWISKEDPPVFQPYSDVVWKEYPPSV